MVCCIAGRTTRAAPLSRPTSSWYVGAGHGGAGYRAGRTCCLALPGCAAVARGMRRTMCDMIDVAAAGAASCARSAACAICPATPLGAPTSGLRCQRRLPAAWGWPRAGVELRLWGWGPAAGSRPVAADGAATLLSGCRWECSQHVCGDAGVHVSFHGAAPRTAGSDCEWIRLHPT